MMKHLVTYIFISALAAVLAALCMPVCAQQKFEMNLWPQGAPNSNGDAADSAKVWVYLPKKEAATGRAVVICPGGGYSHLAMSHEGHDWAPFFNNMGIAAVVLKYRMPHGNREVPVSDAEEAMRLVRRNAQSWGVDAQDVGIMGSSAGGHLASTIATQSTGDAAPDFQILFYPVITMMPDITHKGSHDNLLGPEAKKKDEHKYSNDLQVSRVTRLHRPERRRPRRPAGQRRELLHRAVPPRHAGHAPRLPVGRPRLGQPRLLHVPQRDAARPEGMAPQLLMVIKS